MFPVMIIYRLKPKIRYINLLNNFLKVHIRMINKNVYQNIGIN